MKINKPKNENYAATVVEIKTLIPLEKCDNVQAAIIMGNQVVVSKEVKVGDVGLFFPVETALSKEYLSNNNLYRKSELNVDSLQKGYFEENGRIRCVKFRGHKSEGLFMPIESMDTFLPYPTFEGLEIGVCFDELNDTPICCKYVVKQNRTPGQSGSKQNKADKKYESKLVENQFRFHEDTSQLYRNVHKINPDDLISITYKVHGTSGISSYVLCKRNIPIREKIGSWLHNIYTRITSFGKQRFVLEQIEYDYLYSSRKVIKNAELNPNAQHFYNEDIWGIAHNEVKEFLQKGMTFYYEIVGYLPNGKKIQKDYDYGCEPTKHAIYIYRITSTNIDGKVIEFSAKQVQDFCKKNGLNAVPELYYGEAQKVTRYDYWADDSFEGEEFGDWFLRVIKAKYNEKDCYMCSNPLPEEGVVIRVEGIDFEAFKCKSNRFYEYETVQLDKGEVNIEE
jgi:hypothetical protein